MGEAVTVEMTGETAGEAAVVLEEVAAVLVVEVVL